MLFRSFQQNRIMDKDGNDIDDVIDDGNDINDVKKYFLEPIIN